MKINVSKLYFCPETLCAMLTNLGTLCPGTLCSGFFDLDSFYLSQKFLMVNVLSQD